MKVYRGENILRVFVGLVESLPKSLLGYQRFRWGISIDNMWRYADAEIPKSVVIPYLLSIRLPRGPDRIAPDIDPRSIDSEIGEKGSLSSEIGESEIYCRELAAELKNRNIDFVRCWFQWNFFEPQVLPDNSEDYRFPLDNFVSAMTSNNIELLAVIGNGYSRFLPKGINTDNLNDYLKRLCKMTRAVVAHYKGSISTWQIENEPNWWEEHTATHWRSGGIWIEPNTRGPILGSLHDTVKEEDSSATIIVNLEADEKKTPWNFYSRYCDVLGLDFYPNYMRSSPVDASEVKFSSEVKRITGIPVFVAETGYPSGPSFFGYDRSKQAEYVRSACKESFQRDDIAALCMWRYSDSYWRSFPFQENYFGLLDKEGNPKPAWIEFHNQIEATK
jgi:hypothetical protein